MLVTSQQHVMRMMVVVMVTLMMKMLVRFKRRTVFVNLADCWLAVFRHLFLACALS